MSDLPGIDVRSRNKVPASPPFFMRRRTSAHEKGRLRNVYLRRTRRKGKQLCHRHPPVSVHTVGLLWSPDRSSAPIAGHQPISIQLLPLNSSQTRHQHLIQPSHPHRRRHLLTRKCNQHQQCCMTSPPPIGIPRIARTHHRHRAINNLLSLSCLKQTRPSVCVGELHVGCWLSHSSCF